MSTTTTPQADPAKSFRVIPGAKLLQLKDLKEGHVFQYQGGDATEWNTVLKVDDQQVYYRQGSSHIPATNWRSYGSIYVWVKEAKV